MLESFRHLTKFRVPFCDVDMMQHVNHCSYIRWAETARSEYFVDIMGERVNGERGLILARVDFTYERQLSYREYVSIGSRVTRIGNKSFELAYEIWSDDTQERAAFGITAMVAYDYLAHASIRVPETWRERIAAYETLKPEGV